MWRRAKAARRLGSRRSDEHDQEVLVAFNTVLVLLRTSPLSIGEAKRVFAIGFVWIIVLMLAWLLRGRDEAGLIAICTLAPVGFVLAVSGSVRRRLVIGFLMPGLFVLSCGVAVAAIIAVRSLFPESS
jgi:hypothetical protein